MEPVSPQPPPEPVPVSQVGQFLRRARITIIVLFVCWHLFSLLFRNIFDLWWDDLVPNGLKKLTWWEVPVLTMHQNFPNDPRHVELTPGKVFSTIDMATYRYLNYFGIEQGWSMFSPPIARRAAFVAAEIQFADGSNETLLSPNEFPFQGYFRWDGWRQRKLEDNLVYATPESIEDKSDPQLFEAYVRWSVRRWRDQNPEDLRVVSQVKLLKRNWSLPGPEEDPHSHFLEITEISTFTPDGKLIPRKVEPE